MNPDLLDRMGYHDLAAQARIARRYERLNYERKEELENR